MTSPIEAPPTVWRVEMHCHTYRSGDSLADPERVLATARRRKIDRLAITDHNTIAGALEVYALDPGRVIVGEEIMTTEGELLAYYVQQEVPAGLSPEAAIRLLRDQGAVIGVSHPFDAVRKGAWDKASLRRILPLIDAIEILNARTWAGRPNRMAAKWAREAGLVIDRVIALGTGVPEGDSVRRFHRFGLSGRSVHLARLQLLARAVALEHGQAGRTDAFVGREPRAA